MKARLVRSDRNRHKWSPIDELLGPRLHRAGLKLVNDEKESCDVTLLDTRVLEDREHCRTDGPVILLDFYDCAGLQFERVRRMLQEPDVRALFRNSLFRDRGLYNAPTAGFYHYHGHLINQKLNLVRSEPNPVKLGPEALGKLRLVPFNLDSSPLRPRLHPLYRRWWKLLKWKRLRWGKPYALFFAGSSDYANPVISAHRRCCAREIAAIAGLPVLRPGRLQFEPYLRGLSLAKTAVSPWGYGEWCHRDFEAILTETLLIKPDTGFLEMVPNVFADCFYLRCAVDFSDIGELVRMVVDNWRDYRGRLADNRRYLLERFDLDGCADTFRRAVARALEGG